MQAMPRSGENLNTAVPSANKQKGFPIGTIRNGRQKVGSNPSKWVDLHSGHSYDEHNSADTGAHKAPNLSAGETKVLDKVKSAIPPADHAKASSLMTDWVQKKHTAKNLQQASNVHSSTTRGDLSSDHIKNSGKAFDAANKAKDTLINFLKESVKRKANG